MKRIAALWLSVGWAAVGWAQGEFRVGVGDALWAEWGRPVGDRSVRWLEASVEGAVPYVRVLTFYEDRLLRLDRRYLPVWRVERLFYPHLSGAVRWEWPLWRGGAGGRWRLSALAGVRATAAAARLRFDSDRARNKPYWTGMPPFWPRRIGWDLMGDLEGLLRIEYHFSARWSLMAESGLRWTLYHRLTHSMPWIGAPAARIGIRRHWPRRQSQPPKINP